MEKDFPLFHKLNKIQIHNSMNIRQRLYNHNHRIVHKVCEPLEDRPLY